MAKAKKKHTEHTAMDLLVPCIDEYTVVVSFIVTTIGAWRKSYGKASNCLFRTLSKFGLSLFLSLCAVNTQVKWKYVYGRKNEANIVNNDFKWQTVTTNFWLYYSPHLGEIDFHMKYISKSALHCTRHTLPIGENCV